MSARLVKAMYDTVTVEHMAEKFGVKMGPRLRLLILERLNQIGTWFMTKDSSIELILGTEILAETSEVEAREWIGAERARNLLAATAVPSPQPKDESLVADVLRLVCEHYGVTNKMILGPSRIRSTSRPRQVAIFLCRRDLGLNLDTIAKAFARDRSTVLNSIRCVEYETAQDPNFFVAVELIATRLKELMERRAGMEKEGDQR